MSRVAGAGPTVRIGLLGMYASVNLGDTSIQMAVMQALRARIPAVEFLAICNAPDDAAATFGVPARNVSGFGPIVTSGPACERDDRAWRRTPLPAYLAAAAWKIDRHVRDLDLLLVSGSGQLDDYWGGPWEQPYRLLVWTAAARRHGVPVAYFGVGVDQLLSRAGKTMVRWALERAGHRVVRDTGSREALQAMGVRGQIQVAPDPAFALRSPELEAPTPEAGHVDHPARGVGATPRAVVISPIARSAWPGQAGLAYEQYLDALAQLADHVLDRGLELVFACSQTRMDPPVVPRVQAAMRRDAAAARVVVTASVDDYLRTARSAAVVVGSRLHAVILSLVAGTPVVAVSYARKVRQQMDDAGLGAYTLDLERLDPAHLRQRVDAAIVDRDRLADHVGTVARGFRRELEHRFDELAALALQRR